MTSAEVNTLIVAVQEYDQTGFLSTLVEELRAQRDQPGVGMTEVLLNYQEELRMAQQVDQRIEEEVKEYGDTLDAVAGEKVTGVELTKSHDGTAFVVVYLDEKNNLWKEFRHEGESIIVKVGGKTTLRGYRGYN